VGGDRDLGSKEKSAHGQGFMQAVPLGVASAAQGVAIALLQARPEPEAKTPKTLRYKRKITVLLRNDTGRNSSAVLVNHSERETGGRRLAP